ncbi:MAG TPA: polysaccharide export protein EpsE [Methylophilaceae bacterium]
MKRFVIVILSIMMAVWMMDAATAAVAAGANTTGDLVLGSGDQIKITVYDHPELELETRVGEGGNIAFPLIGDVKIGGLTAADAQKKIAGLLVSGAFLRKAEVNIVVTLMQSQQVSVLGEVLKPGRFPIDNKISVIDALALAGGVVPDGGDEVTLIHRANGTNVREQINLDDLVRSVDMQQDKQLTGGDILYVEKAPNFYIYGEVQHPGAYRLQRNMTVLQALSVGGGLTPRGTDKNMHIKRHTTDGQTQDIKAKHDDVVQVDDVVYVRESLF